ncbi:MAG TPA: energy transducer TonB [Pyrinomonadaceae bacterium]|nr:energy transducer TonB [Pyrinomonadaceae bacterium]
MRHLLMFCAIVGIAALCPSFANSQTGAMGLFEKAELSFNFPGTWKATDNSIESFHHITVATTDDAVEISIISQPANAANCDFRPAVEKITKDLIKSTADRIHASRQTSQVKTLIGSKAVKGLQLRGRTNNAPVTVEIYSLRMGFRFVSLTYIRPASDSKGQPAWQLIRSTLKVDPVVITGGRVVQPKEAANPDVMNGQALHLENPVYPAGARQARAAGTILVRVTIGEKGNVIAARAVEGHPLLRASAVAAARKSKFSPTRLCGEPVRVLGIITYNFAEQ